MGLFNKGENAAIGIKRALNKYGIQANVDVFKGMILAVAENVGYKGTELSVTWQNRKSIDVMFHLGSDPSSYHTLSDFAENYNEDNSPFSKVTLCEKSQVLDREINKAWIEGCVPASSCKDSAEEAELFLDIILEDIFVTHKDVISRLFKTMKEGL